METEKVDGGPVRVITKLLPANFWRVTRIRTAKGSADPAKHGADNLAAVPAVRGASGATVPAGRTMAAPDPRMRATALEQTLIGVLVY
jgi:hypothetical protein